MARHELVAVGGLPDWMMAELRAAYRVHDLAGGDRSAALTAASGAGAAVTVGTVGIDAETIDRLPQLKLVSCFGLGYDKVDLAALKRRGIALTNTIGVVERCVADHAIGLMIALMRRIALADRLMRAGLWPKKEVGLTKRVCGRRIGILGLGRIGVEIAKRAAGFDMPIGYYNRNQRADLPFRYFPSLVHLAEWADCLIVACPGGAATRHLVDDEAIEALGPDGVLVNIARGTIIDEAALIRALVKGKLGAAALDVFEDEPKVPPELARLDNVVLTPHVAGGTQETWREAFDLMCDNVAAFYVGEKLLTPVDF